MRPSPLAALALLLTTHAALASQPFALEGRGGASVLSGPESFRAYYVGDNDSLPPMIAPDGHPYDRWYSASTMLGARWALAPELLRLPKDARVLLSVSLGQNIYTPRSPTIATKEELRGDRPYSGWLKASAGLDVLLPHAPLAFIRGGQPYTHLSLDLHGGAQGPWSLAGWPQHRGNIETQPGLSADVSAFAETTLVSLDAAPPRWMEWAGGRPTFRWMGGLAGHAGSMLLAGAAHTTITAGWTGDPLGREQPSLPAAAYVFARAEIRRVGHNATIDRPILDGSVVAHHEPWLDELAFGVVLRAWHLEASAGPVFRTHETATVWDGFRAGQLIWQGSLSWVQ
ncbi:MAG TPA: lipid A-modifier LpxR family protein [Myxococcaceae bacterium]|jgi:hypothetical protein